MIYSKKAKGGFFCFFLTQQYMLSHIDLYLKPRKEAPGIPYHGLSILKNIPQPEKILVNSPKFNHNQKALYHQNP